MLGNLKAEMARKNITNNQIANCIGKDAKTIKRKNDGVAAPYSIEDAILIQEKFFPTLELKYLFARN